MQPSKKGKDHPEIKNICDVAPKAKSTKDVCEVIKEKPRKK